MSSSCTDVELDFSTILLLFYLFVFDLFERFQAELQKRRFGGFWTLLALYEWTFSGRFEASEDVSLLLGDVREGLEDVNVRHV